MKLPIRGLLFRAELRGNQTPIPFIAGTRVGSKAHREAIRRVSGRRRGLSPISVKFWRLFAHGTSWGRPGGVLRVWPKWERLAHSLWPMMAIPAAPYGAIQIRLLPYKGERVLLPDGSVVEKNATVCELHCSNIFALRMFESRAITAIRACREDLHSLACWVKQSPAAKDLVAVYGRGTLLTVLALRLGFTARESPNRIRRRIDRFFMIGLLLMYTDAGMHRLTQGTTLSRVPSEIWMTRDRLIDLYGDRQGQPLTFTETTK